MIRGREADESSIYGQNESNCRNRQFLEFHLRLHGAIGLEFLKLLWPMHQQIESKDHSHFIKLTTNHYLNIHHVVIKLLLQIVIEIIWNFYILEHSRKLVDAIGRHANMTKIFDIPCFFCLKMSSEFFHCIEKFYSRENIAWFTWSIDMLRTRRLVKCNL